MLQLPQVCRGPSILSCHSLPGFLRSMDVKAHRCMQSYFFCGCFQCEWKVHLRNVPRQTSSIEISVLNLNLSWVRTIDPGAKKLHKFAHSTLRVASDSIGTRCCLTELCGCPSPSFSQPSTIYNCFLLFFIPIINLYRCWVQAGFVT